MMAVSCTKAMLVILFFMHLKWEANWKWVLTIPATFMSMLLVFMLVPDVGWRMNNGFYALRAASAVCRQPGQVEASDVNAAEEELSHEGAH